MTTEHKKPQPTFAKKLTTAAFAGGIAGGVEICITYPTEFVKTQLQLSEGGKALYSGNMDCVKQTISQKGFFGLYKGLSPLLAFSIPKAAVRFAGYEGAKAQLFPNVQNLNTQQSLLCGTIAGALEATFVVCPQETIKVKYIHDTRRAVPQYKGLIHGIRAIYGELGFKGIYAGYIPTLLKQSTNQMIRFGVLNTMKNAYKGDDPNKEVPIYMVGLFGAIAGAASVFGNTPIDVIKTKMQGLEAHKYSGTVDCVKKTFAEDGFRGFYKGTTARLGRVVADVAIVFMLFDYIKPPIGKAVDYSWKKAGWE